MTKLIRIRVRREWFKQAKNQHIFSLNLKKKTKKKHAIKHQIDGILFENKSIINRVKITTTLHKL